MSFSLSLRIRIVINQYVNFLIIKSLISWKRSQNNCFLPSLLLPLPIPKPVLQHDGCAGKCGILLFPTSSLASTLETVLESEASWAVVSRRTVPVKCFSASGEMTHTFLTVSLWDGGLEKLSSTPKAGRVSLLVYNTRLPAGVFLDTCLALENCPVAMIALSLHKEPEWRGPQWTEHWAAI